MQPGAYSKHTVLCISEFVKSLELILHVLTTKTKTKGHKETHVGVGYFYYLDCTDGIIGVHICPNSLVAYIKHMQFFICSYTSNCFLKKALGIGIFQNSEISVLYKSNMGHLFIMCVTNTPVGFGAALCN